MTLQERLAKPATATVSPNDAACASSSLIAHRARSAPKFSNQLRGVSDDDIVRRIAQVAAKVRPIRDDQRECFAACWIF